MTNVLPGQVNLTIHCKSGDDELGYHVLPSRLLGISILTLGTTLYFCSFKWPGNLPRYDIYNKIVHVCSTMKPRRTIFSSLESSEPILDEKSPRFNHMRTLWFMINQYKFS
ncbi:uncharacterized protein J3R85_001563 [Psidium guajava]|nr:uncharacterized protein J3R85_001563 [Psidium guajava]